MFILNSYLGKGKVGSHTWYDFSSAGISGAEQACPGFHALESTLWSAHLGVSTEPKVLSFFEF